MSVSYSTLDSGIDVGQEIKVGPGKFGKKNKHGALNKRRVCKICQKVRSLLIFYDKFNIVGPLNKAIEN